MPIKEQQSNPKTLLYFVLHNSGMEETEEQNKIWQKNSWYKTFQSL